MSAEFRFRGAKKFLGARAGQTGWEIPRLRGGRANKHLLTLENLEASRRWGGGVCFFLGGGGEASAAARFDAGATAGLGGGWLEVLVAGRRGTLFPISCQNRGCGRREDDARFWFWCPLIHCTASSATTRWWSLEN